MKEIIVEKNDISEIFNFISMRKTLERRKDFHMQIYNQGHNKLSILDLKSRRIIFVQAWEPFSKESNEFFEKSQKKSAICVFINSFTNNIQSIFTEFGLDQIRNNILSKELIFNAFNRVARDIPQIMSLQSEECNTYCMQLKNDLNNSLKA